MKKIIVIFLSLISLRGFAFEQGPTRGYNLSGLSGDLGYGVRVAAGIGSPTYIWRKYNENVNFVIRDIALFEFGSDRGNSTQRDLRFHGYPLRVSAPDGMSLRVLNERIRAVQNGPMEILEISRSGNEINARAVLRSTSGREMQLARVSSDLEVEIPTSISDGTYTLATRFSGSIYVYLYGSGGFYNVPFAFSAPSNNFEVLTYLQITIDNIIDFGKVIFTSGAGKIIKKGKINIFGGHNVSIKVKRLEEKVLLKQVGREKAVVPIFIKLIDGKNNGEEVSTKLDATGIKSLEYEVRIEPGLYPDIPEGKYTGVARFEVKYN